MSTHATRDAPEVGPVPTTSEDENPVPLPERIIELMHEQAAISNQKLLAAIDRDTVLLDTGLDSLSFATIIVLLEQEYGVDPFTARSEAIYPRTFGELVEQYTEELQRRERSTDIAANQHNGSAS